MSRQSTSSESNEPFDEYYFKLIFVGSVGVGKTNLVSRFSRNQFQRTRRSTVGIDIETKPVLLRDCVFNLMMWDTAGLERFDTLTNVYYRGVDGAMLVYDVCDRNTFNDLAGWLAKLRNHCDEDLPTILVGNKIDCSRDREVTAAEGRLFAEEHGLSFSETSALTGANVASTFMMLVEGIYGSHRRRKRLPTDIRINPGLPDLHSVRHGSASSVSSRTTAGSPCRLRMFYVTVASVIMFIIAAVVLLVVVLKGKGK